MRDILEKLSKGEISVDEAERSLKLNQVENVTNVARLDIGRVSRRGVPEIVLAEGKSNEDLTQICQSMLEKNGRVLVSRVSEQQLGIIRNLGPYEIEKPPHAALALIRSKGSTNTKSGGRVGIITAGTVDLAAAEESATIAREMGCEAFIEVDAGVAGLHRLVEPLTNLMRKDVDVLVVVAGREGALPTVVAGLVDLPIVALPTSSGYGYGGHGRAALMAMLQACSLGLAVVNIDSGIAAGVVAAQIANRVARARSRA